MYVERKRELLAQADAWPVLVKADSHHVSYTFAEEITVGLTRGEFARMVAQVLEHDASEAKKGSHTHFFAGIAEPALGTREDCPACQKGEDDTEDLTAVLCGDCAGHFYELVAAGLNPSSLHVVTTKAQGYDWHAKYAEGVPLGATDTGVCIGCGIDQDGKLTAGAAGD